MRGIDKAPPRPTGDAREDLRALQDYLQYLQTTLNRLFAEIERKTGGENNGV